MRPQPLFSGSDGDRPRPDGGRRPRTGAPREDDREGRFREIYERWFDDVVKWLYALGVPGSDTEDLAQEIFLVVQAEAGPLRRRKPGRLVVPDRAAHRARSPAAGLVQEPHAAPPGRRPRAVELTTPGPAARYEEAENRRILQALVAGMSEKLRTAFVLFEIEGYSGEEIARIQDIPLGTVWTRLHLARKEFWKLLKKQRDEEEPEAMNRLRDTRGGGRRSLFRRGVELLRRTPPTAAPADVSVGSGGRSPRGEPGDAGRARWS